MLTLIFSTVHSPLYEIYLTQKINLFTFNERILIHEIIINKWHFKFKLLSNQCMHGMLSKHDYFDGRNYFCNNPRFK